MTLRPALSPILVVLLVVSACDARAQDASVDDTRSIDACVAVENDALRLACYDTAAGRDTRTPVQADAAAERARAYQRQNAQEQTDQGQVNLFRADPQTPTDRRVDAALANAGKGSLLDSRWELARDSKLGLFNFRAYKPVYLFPAFWTAESNTRPRSPNPDNTASEETALDQIEAKFQISFQNKVVENRFGDNR